MTNQKTKQLQEEYNNSTRSKGIDIKFIDDKTCKAERKGKYPYKQIAVLKYAIHALWVLVILMFIHALMVY